jgi:hypothetical protein
MQQVGSFFSEFINDFSLQNESRFVQRRAWLQVYSNERHVLLAKHSLH